MMFVSFMLFSIFFVSVIGTASHFLYALEILEKMDEVIDIFLNISNNPVAINDEEYLQKLNTKVSPQQIDTTSNRRLQELIDTTTTSQSEDNSSVVSQIDDDDVM